MRDMEDKKNETKFTKSSLRKIANSLSIYPLMAPKKKNSLVFTECCLDSFLLVERLTIVCYLCPVNKTNRFVQNRYQSLVGMQHALQSIAPLDARADGLDTEQDFFVCYGPI